MSGNLRLILTGASGGIGRCLAAALAPQCSAMLLVGRDSATLQALQRELQEGNASLQVSTVTADLASDAGRESVLANARDLPGGVNLLINNAGLSDFHAFSTQDEGIIEAMLQVNLLSPILLSRKLFPLIEANGGGQIVNIGSVFGDIGYPGFAAYCASKAGLRGFSQALRRELADSNVRVRYFAPRATRTDSNSSAVNHMNAALGTAMDEPTVVAAAFLHFLAGDKAEAVLGWPEQLYVFLNRLRHQLTDQAIGKQLRVIKQYLPV